MLITTYLASLDDWPGKVDVTQGTEYSNALCAGAYFGHVNIVELLLQDGAAVNMQKECGSALVYASQNGNVEIVQMLLEHIADVNIRAGEDVIYAALRAAGYGGHASVIRVIQTKLLFGNSVGVNPERGRPEISLPRTEDILSFKKYGHPPPLLIPTIPPIPKIPDGASRVATSYLF